MSEDARSPEAHTGATGPDDGGVAARVRRVVNAVVPALGYDDRLAREVLDGEGDAIAAIASFERQEPASLTAAAQLLSGHGTLTPEAFDRVACAYDIYRHVRNMPCD